MEREINSNLSVKYARGRRRAMLMFVAFAYLFVGIAHNVSCVDQADASSVMIENTLDISDDGAGTSGIAIGDHCSTCVPAVLPAPIVAEIPSALAVSPIVTATALPVPGHPRIETPPPKHVA